MKIIRLDSQLEKQYKNFIESQDNTLFFHSNEYRYILKDFLHADDHYLLAVEDENIKAALPCFLLRSNIGSVLNSLPFYGSNGGIIGNNQEARLALISAFNDLAVQFDCISSTIVVSPFEQDIQFYDNHSGHTFRDERIGQVCPLPYDKHHIDEALMNQYHYKTRNMIRKAQKLDIEIKIDNSTKALDFLITIHHENMQEIGGTPKPREFFVCLLNRLRPELDYNIYIGTFDAKPVAALLLVYFNKIVEYFTPVVKKEYRACQPLSLIIYSAMIDAVARGFSLWNWGGTWLSQHGVYTFKKRWGTMDKPYYYYNKIYNRALLKYPQKLLLEKFPFFYVVPFGRLES